MATTTRVAWLSKQKYVGINSSKHSVLLSAQEEENATGMNPP